jgi:hypothetical protein
MTPPPEQGVAIVQLPCPEEHAWGGVTKRWLLAFYGAAESSRLLRLKAVLLPFMLFYIPSCVPETRASGRNSGS